MSLLPSWHPPCSALVSSSECLRRQRSRTLEVPVPDNTRGAKCRSSFPADPAACLGRCSLLGMASALGPRQATSAWVGSGRQRRNLEESRAAANCYHSVLLLSASASGFQRKPVIVLLVSAGKTLRCVRSPCSGPEAFGKAEKAGVYMRAKHIRYAAIPLDITRNAPVVQGRF